ncbi:hypothetical protein Droror1_Dr00006907, partial [Drosera rotundifolia]
AAGGLGLLVVGGCELEPGVRCCLCDSKFDSALPDVWNLNSKLGFGVSCVDN